MAATYLQHRRFFDLPLAAKLSVRHSGGESPARGYSPWAYEKTAVLRPDLHTAPSIGDAAAATGIQRSPSDPPPSPTTGVGAGAGKQPSPTTLLDAREQFAIGPAGDTTFPTPQISEELLPGFNEATSEAYMDISDMCRKLVDAIEKGLGAPPGSITGPTAGGLGAELNLNFYPKVGTAVLEDFDQDAGPDDARSGGDRPADHGRVAMRRIWPHSDLGVVSALFQDEAGASGLEVQIRDSSPGDTFAPVSIEREGDVVLLVSDTLERWTNGYLRAAVHRVGLPPAVKSSKITGSETESRAAHVPERRSAVMFFRAPPTADLGPLLYFVSAQSPARYERVTAAEYLRTHNKILY